MEEHSNIPKFGPLSGVKVFSTGSIIGAPFAAALMGEFGAEVIQVESALFPDGTRQMKYWWEQEHRNQRSIALDFCTPEGKEIFLQLIERSDIWLESSKGCTYDKWGLSDEVVWEHNPRLVIVHVSGYGQSGVPEYVNRGSFDPIGQAYSGFLNLNGLPDLPMKSNPFVCDYMTALTACWSALAALLKARETGKGESIDISQYEVMFKTQVSYPMMYFNDRVQIGRFGNGHPVGLGVGVYKSLDGKYFSMLVAGAGPIKAIKPVLGLEGDPDFPDGMQMAARGTAAGAKLEKAIVDFCSSHTGDELQKIFSDAKVPAQLVYDYEQIEKDPHYQARQDIIEWEDFQYGKVKGVGIFPKFKNHPGQVWRSAPLYGQDNDEILMELGFDCTQIEKLYEKKVIAKKNRR